MANESENQLDTIPLKLPDHFSIDGDQNLSSSLASSQGHQREPTNFSETLFLIDQVAEIDITEFRKHPAYSMYLNWSRLLVLGIIPFSLLVFFNSKIYNDINERRKRRLR